MTGVEEAVGRLETTATDLEGTEDLAWFAQIDQPKSATRLALAADIRALLSALSEMQADISGRGGRVVSEEVAEQRAALEVAIRLMSRHLEMATPGGAGQDSNAYRVAAGRVETLRRLATALEQATTAGVGR